MCKSTTTEPIRDKHHIREMAAYYLRRGKLRNHHLIVLGVYTGLRISDLLRLRVVDVYDFEAHRYRAHLHIVEGKTKKPKCIALNKRAIAALVQYLGLVPGDPGTFLFQSKRKHHAAIGRTQAWRIVKEAAKAVGAMGRISCHSLRKTLGYHAWKAGVQAVLLMDIYNHSSFDVTRRYLGIAQDDRDEVYLGLALT